jgi:hypothetical protein
MSNLKQNDQAAVAAYASNNLHIAALSKDALIELHRKAFGRVGDTGRTGRDAYQERLESSCSDAELRAYAAELVGGDIAPVVSQVAAAVAKATAVPVPAITAAAAPVTGNKALLAKQMADMLASAIGGIDEEKIQAMVKVETDRAIASVRILAEQMQNDGREAGRLAREARNDAETMRQEFAKAAETAKASAEQAVVEAIAKSIPKRIEYKAFDGVIIDAGIQHKTFPKLLKLLTVPGVNVWLAGPAGSGKTTACEAVAKALNKAFYHIGKVLSEFQLIGYKDAHGHYHSTPFYEAYTKGGLFLLDEVDGSAPDAILALNMAIENGHMAFPDGQHAKHPDFQCVAAANTFGLGATADYVGRNKQDAAFLDRFVTLVWGYDEAFELMLCGNAAWHKKVVAWRGRAVAKGIKVIISPRASIIGAKLLLAEFPESEVIDMVVKKGMTEDQWRSIA